MYSYIKYKGATDIFKPVKIVNNTFFTRDHHNKFLRISNVITLTLTPDLQDDFYCRIRIFEGGQLRVNTDNCICKGLEGTFVEENQTCEIIRLENGDFELLRERPVNVDNYTRVGSVDISAGFCRIPQFSEGKIRLMNGGAILLESAEEELLQLNDMSEYNSEGNNLAVYTSSNILKTTSAASWLTEVFLEKWDFTYPPQQLTFQRIKYIQGVDKLPLNKNANFLNCTSEVYQEIFLKSPQKIIDCQNGAVADVENFDFNFVCSDKPNLEQILSDKTISTGASDWKVENNPNLEKIDMYYNSPACAFNSFLISNCPKISYIKIQHFYNGGPDKNFDQVMIDLDNNGISDGYVLLDASFVFTAASDPARANLASKNWDLQLQSLQ